MNAFTGREHTAFYARLPADELAFGLDLLADVVVDPAFRADEVDAEREVILEELPPAWTRPTTASTSRSTEAVFPGHPLGPRGPRQRRDRRRPRPRHHRRLPRSAGTGPTNLVVAAAGDRRPRRRRRAGSTDRFPAVEPTACSARTPPGDRRRAARDRRPARPSRPTSPWAGAPCPPATPTATPWPWPTRSSAAACRAACSRRSARSGAWPTRSTPRPRPTSDAGQFTVYAGTAPSRPSRCSSVIDDEIDRLLADGITEDERGRRPGLPRGLAGARPRGHRQPHGPPRRAHEHRSAGSCPSTSTWPRMRAVTLDDVAAVLERVLGGPRVAWPVVGPPATTGIETAALAGLGHDRRGVGSRRHDPACRRLRRRRADGGHGCAGRRRRPRPRAGGRRRPVTTPGSTCARSPGTRACRHPGRRRAPRASIRRPSTWPSTSPCGEAAKKNLDWLAAQRGARRGRHHRLQRRRTTTGCASSSRPATASSPPTSPSAPC